jgi:O-antigen ligase
VLQGREVLGLPPGWAPVSLAPYTTFSNLLFLLPPVAIVVAVVNTRAEGTLWIAVALIAATFAGVLLGLLQVGSGNPIASPWYLYRFSNFGFATGFFANSNHMASLLLVALPFIFALGLTASARVKKDPRKRYSILGLTVAGAGVAAIGIAMNGSLAGAGLLLPVAVASLLLLVRPSARVAWAIGGLGVVAVAAFLALLSSPIGERLAMSGASTSMSTRQEILAHSVDALKEFNWVGSGIGTYAEIYPLFEDPDAIGPTYVNHAHSDYIEIAVETGVAGILLLALFLGWWLMTLRRTVTAPNASLFARAGLIGSAAILLHSLVDYPLRTSALSAAFAFCLAVMLLSRDSARSSKDLREARHLVIE